MRNVIKILFLLLGLTGSVYAAVPVVQNYSKASKVVISNVGLKENEGKIVALKGKVNITPDATDLDLEIETEHPVLNRQMEMVQWTLVNGEPALVLADGALESPDAEHVNPTFDSILASKSFFGETHIEDCVLELDDAIKEQILTYGETTEYKELPENNGNRYGLAMYDGYYATARNNWECGDLCITYTVTDFSDLEVTIIGVQKEGILTDCIGLYEGIKTDKEIKNLVMDDLKMDYLIGGISLGLLVIGGLIRRKK